MEHTELPSHSEIRADLMRLVYFAMLGTGAAGLFISWVLM